MKILDSMGSIILFRETQNFTNCIWDTVAETSDKT